MHHMSDPHNIGASPPPLDMPSLQAAYASLSKLDRELKAAADWLSRALEAATPTERQGGIFNASRAVLAANAMVYRGDLQAAVCIIRAAVQVSNASTMDEPADTGPPVTVAEVRVAER